MTDLITSLQKLDPENDNHWTKDGAPRLETLQMFLGGQPVTREMISEQAPGFNRATWTEHKRAENTPTEAKPSIVVNVGNSVLSPRDIARFNLETATNNFYAAERALATAKLEMDKHLISEEKKPEAIGHLIRKYHDSQREKLEERQRRKEALKGVNLKDILPEISPLDAAFRRVNQRGTSRPK